MTIAKDIEALVQFIFQICVIFPYSALTIQRQRLLIHSINPNSLKESDSSSRKSRIMISERVYKLCTNSQSVSGLLAKDPTLAPGDAWKQLYGSHIPDEKSSISTAEAKRDTITPADLKRASECGNWGATQPSELFLRVSMICR